MDPSRVLDDYTWKYIFDILADDVNLCTSRDHSASSIISRITLRNLRATCRRFAQLISREYSRVNFAWLVTRLCEQVQPDILRAILREPTDMANQRESEIGIHYSEIENACQKSRFCKCLIEIWTVYPKLDDITKLDEIHKQWNSGFYTYYFIIMDFLRIYGLNQTIKFIRQYVVSTDDTETQQLITSACQEYDINSPTHAQALKYYSRMMNVTNPQVIAENRRQVAIISLQLTLAEYSFVMKNGKLTRDQINQLPLATMSIHDCNERRTMLYEAHDREEEAAAIRQYYRQTKHYHPAIQITLVQPFQRNSIERPEVRETLRDSIEPPYPIFARIGDRELRRFHYMYRAYLERPQIAPKTFLHDNLRDILAFAMPDHEVMYNETNAYWLYHYIIAPNIEACNNDTRKYHESHDVYPYTQRIYNIAFSRVSPIARQLARKDLHFDDRAKLTRSIGSMECQTILQIAFIIQTPDQLRETLREFGMCMKITPNCIKMLCEAILGNHINIGAHNCASLTVLLQETYMNTSRIHVSCRKKDYSHAKNSEFGQFLRKIGISVKPKKF